MLQQQRRSRRVLLRLPCRSPGLRPGSGGRRRPPFLPSGWAGPAPRTKAQLRNSIRRHCEVHLGRAPGALVAHEAAVQGVVHHEVGVEETAAARAWAATWGAWQKEQQP